MYVVLTVERLLAIFLALISGFILYESAAFPKIANEISMQGPEFVPKLIAYLLLFFSLILSTKKKQRKLAFADNGKAIQEKALCLLLLVIYGLVMLPVGYLLSTCMLLSCLLYLAGVREPKAILLISVGVIFAIYFVFGFALDVMFPQGILPF